MKVKYIAPLVFGILAIVTGIISGVMVYKIFNPEYVIAADMGDIEELAYSSLDSYYDTVRNKLLSCEESDVHTSDSVFLQELNRLYDGDLKLYPKTFKVTLEYTFGNKNSTGGVTRQKTNRYDAMCFSRVVDGNLYSVGILMINNELYGSERVRIITKDYSTDVPAYVNIFVYSFLSFAVSTAAVIIVSVYMRKQDISNNDKEQLSVNRK